MSKDVLVCNLNPGLVRHEFHSTLLELVMHDIRHDGRIAYNVARVAGGCLGIYRNMAVEHFLSVCQEDDTLEWMWFVDSDIKLKPDTLDTLLSINQPIVAGLYYMALDEGIVPSVFDWEERDGKYHYWPRMDLEVNGHPVTCGGTGAGCLLIHKDVFGKMLATYGPPSPWFAESVHQGVALGEDFTFCLRAMAEGFPIVVHTGAEVGHVKQIVIDHNYATPPEA